jgi:WhiB family redox-sensing transcriptional regulator
MVRAGARAQRRFPAFLPVQAECLELELRMNGDLTVGVWGALCEDDRRALIPHRRRDAKGVEHGLQ